MWAMLTVDASWYRIACTHSSHKRAMLTVDASWYRIARTHSSHKRAMLTVDAKGYRMACIHSFHNRVRGGLLIMCERTVRPVEMDLISYAMGQPKLNMSKVF